jgi:hypothetical protein
MRSVGASNGTVAPRRLCCANHLPMIPVLNQRTAYRSDEE